MQPTTQPLLERSHRARMLAPIAVFAIALGLTACLLTVLKLPQYRDSLAYRYICGHPIEECETWLFLWGMTALGWKAWQLRAERRVLRTPVLTLPGSRAVAIAEITNLLHMLADQPARFRSTWLVRRLTDAMSYVQQRGSADGLEDRLIMLGDRDANEADGGYELVRTITWAIPILGFLGTVIGITIAIANITPEQLQDSLSEVIGGLAIAFDTTALALALSMILVAGRFCVERAERGVLARVDALTEALLLDRFERVDPETKKFLTSVERVADVVLRVTRDAWREQGQLWMKTIEQIGASHVATLQAGAQKIIEQTGQAARQLALDQSHQFADLIRRLETSQQAAAATVHVLREAARDSLSHAREEARQNALKQDTQFQHFLTSLETLRNVCHKSLSDVAAKMTAHHASVKRQTDLIAQLVADEGRLSKLQQALHSNLATLANVQSLDEAIHSLSAAAHLLTARVGRVGPLGPQLAPRSDDDLRGAKEAA